MGEATITQGSGLMGTLQWMSPEQVSKPGSEDQRSDLYSLGVIMYYSLTGISPVKGDEPGAVALSIWGHVPPEPRQVLGTIPAPLSQVCMKLMAKRPEDRFQTAEAFLKALSVCETTVVRPRAHLARRKHPARARLPVTEGGRDEWRRSKVCAGRRRASCSQSEYVGLDAGREPVLCPSVAW
jgi:serine/threonine protein kinase